MRREANSPRISGLGRSRYLLDLVNGNGRSEHTGGGIVLNNPVTGKNVKRFNSTAGPAGAIIWARAA